MNGKGYTVQFQEATSISDLASLPVSLPQACRAPLPLYLSVEGQGSGGGKGGGKEAGNNRDIINHIAFGLLITNGTEGGRKWSTVRGKSSRSKETRRCRHEERGVGNEGRK